MLFRLALVFGLMVLSGCHPNYDKQSGSERSGDTEATASRVPAGLVVESEIKGVVLGLRLQDPTGLAVSPSGAVYLCDAGNNRVIRLDEQFHPRSDTRGYGSDEGSLFRPGYLWLDNDLNLLVADAGNRRLAWFDRQLHYVDELSLVDEEDPLKYGEASSVAATDFGELWVVDWEQGKIAVFDNAGRFQSFVGDFGYTGGQLNRPEKILLDHDGFLVCDAGNSRLVQYDSYGNFNRRITDDLFQYPVSAARAGNTGWWVLDGATGQLFFFDQKWKRVYVTGPLLAGSGQPMKKPSDLIILSDGRLLISDSGNDRLLVCRVFAD